MRTWFTPMAVPVRGMRVAADYNPDMNKPMSRRNVRRTAWWVAFAALAGFLLADLT
ncbi:hypothetical protein LMG23994_04436 [Cupriavidus pinatubonensis]|uniref:Uncharacterized protein n=1 Tax=Cupriavidus pinatubonensis TaxID=248026 RepID=A0ABN7Z895_9BURK|nr:hypothetical protein LMG23994_04436 [Cupriavidus pinatubonensis]